MGIYGPPGSGKTFTSLLIAEGLAQRTKKRIAYVDTERGTDFYCKPVPDRTAHPAAFDFDAMYTRSITDVLKEVKSLDPEQYGVIIIDSITHIWEAAKAAYDGKQTKAGTIPFHAWGKIKKPYKELTSFLLSTPMHVIICGRQGIEYETDEESEELKAVGYKMKAEGETAYEPHILIRMESRRTRHSDAPAEIFGYAEKDRTGVLQGRTLGPNPTFDSICLPLLGLLGGSQGRIHTDEETAAHDAEILAEQDANKEENSNNHLREYTARIALCKNVKDLKDISKTITPGLKASMLPAHVTMIREAYLEREKELERGAQRVANEQAIDAEHRDLSE